MNKSNMIYMNIRSIMEHKFPEFLVDRICQTFNFRRGSNYNRYIFDTFEYIADHIKLDVFDVAEKNIYRRYE